MSRYKIVMSSSGLVRPAQIITLILDIEADEQASFEIHEDARRVIGNQVAEKLGLNFIYMEPK